MKLLRQVRLYFREGRSDKVYEVDLCEVGDDQCVVNFRYGRRGAMLRDGTKTPAPVSRGQAERLFEELVASKTSKGYRHEAGSSPPPPPVEAQAAGKPGQPPLDPRSRAVLARISRGHDPRQRFKLSRAVWRAGELRLIEAEPLLLGLAGSGDPMLDYCIAWALGRIGGSRGDAARDSRVVEVLRSLQANQNRPYAVRRIAAVALLEVHDEEARRASVDGYIAQLPEPLLEFARSGPAERFQEALERHLEGGEQRAFSAIELAYFIDNEHVRPGLLWVLRNCPLKPPYFQRVRRIFKAAELRGDGEVFGLIAYRFETERSNVNSKTYSFQYEVDPQTRRWKRRQQNPFTGAEAKYAFSRATRHYLRQRVWRTLKQLGRAGRAEDYVRLAIGVLLPISDDDGDRPLDTRHYEVNPASRRYEQVAIRYDPFHAFWALGNILYGGGRRYRFVQNHRSLNYYRLQSAPSQLPGEREEAFPALWEQQPRALLHLLDESRCGAVHEFAAKALRACRDFCRSLDLTAVRMLLRAPYEPTLALGFDLAVMRYDAAHPDRELLLALATCNYQRAREQSFAWIDRQRDLLREPSFAAALAGSAFADTRGFARGALKQVSLTDAEAQALIARLVAELQPLGEEQTEQATDLCRTLLEVFGGRLRRIGAEVIRDLLAHPLAAVQQFAGDLVLNHETFAAQPPEEILQGLLGAKHEAVRTIGVRIVGQMPDHVLRGRIDLLISLARSPHADVRESVRPTLVRLASTDLHFGRTIAGRLVEALLVPGAAEGVPSHTAELLKTDLSNYLQDVSQDTVWKLLQSRSAPTQDVGGSLLGKNVKSSDLSVAQIIRLASHDLHSVREAAWSMCRQEFPRLKREVGEATRLVDSPWEDTRRFAFDLFREQFTADDLSTSALVAMCDSVREDVQQFGRELVTRLFDESQGPEYLRRFAEHPSTTMQLFTSNYLDRYAANGAESLAELELFFRSVLSRVNQGRVAKDRVYRLLQREAGKSPEHARVIAGILARQSATIAVGDKARAIEILADIRARYPYIDSPLEIIPVEVRGGV